MTPSIHSLLSKTMKMESSAWSQAVAQRRGSQAAARKERARYEMTTILERSISRSSPTARVWREALLNLDNVYAQ